MANVQQFYNKNQFIINTEKEITFQSYDSTIATINKKNGRFDFWRGLGLLKNHAKTLVFVFERL